MLQRIRRSSSESSTYRRFAALAAAALLLIPIPVGAGLPGGPLYVGGPNVGVSGIAMTWNPATMPIHYRVDPGPMSTNPSNTVIIDNSAGIARVNSMFSPWTSVPTATLSFVNDGPLLGSGTYVAGQPAGSSVSNFNAVVQSCDNGQQSPVIFDPNGSLFNQLGLGTSVIGFSFACAFDTSGGHITAAALTMNGKFQDGVNSGNNFEMPSDLFNQTITHEIGHLVGMDHSQINVEVLNETPLNCNADDAAGLPVMFPVLICQARTTSGVPALAPDDMAWISRLYPVLSPSAGKTVTSSVYGTISGTINFGDAVTAAQGVNIIARQVGNPRRVAFSSVSGYLFTGNPGQTATCQDPAHPTSATCGNLGSSFGSRNTALIGTFDIPVTPGDYTIQLESIKSTFASGSSVGPLDLPIPMPGTAPSMGTVSVQAGTVVSLNINLLGTQPRFDSFESSELLVGDPFWLWQRREDSLALAVAQ